MKILAVDTSSKVCSVALLENDVVIDELILENGKTHSENLMILIDEILKKNQIDINEINLIGCSIGPGSFTGIRIGVCTIKPIAEVLKIKVAGVTSLETLAKNVEAEDAEKIVSLIDARNNQVYFGIFDAQYNKLEEFVADDINNVIEIIKKYEKIICVGDGASLHKDLLKSSLKYVRFAENNLQLASNTGKIAYEKYLKNDLNDADTILPIYRKGVNL